MGHERPISARETSQPKTLRNVGEIAGIVCFIVLLEELIRHVGFFNEGQAVWWPTNGLALALLLRVDRSKWPRTLSAVLLGSLIGQLIHGYPLLTNFANMIANAVGPLLCAWMLPRFRKLDLWLQESRLVGRFVLFPLLLAPFISGSILGAYRHFIVHGHSFWRVMERRGIADMLGYALFTPLVLVLSSMNFRRLAKNQNLLRSILLLIFVAGVAFSVFEQSTFALSFVLASLTLLVTLHLGFSAAVIAVNVIAVIATATTMLGHGPFVLGGGSVVASRIILLQAFLTLNMIAVFSVSVIQIERETFQAKLKVAYEQMEHLATIDPLTGLTNRRLFDESFDIEWTRAYRAKTSIAMLMIDTDDFKSYNDSFGHLAGDDCLTAVAKVALPMKRRSTDLLARYGGEEFIFLLPMNSVASAARIAEAIRSRVEALHEEDGSVLKRKVTVSIGCAAMVPGPGLVSKMLIEASDQALYRAKENGRNRVEVAEPALAEIQV